MYFVNTVCGFIKNREDKYFTKNVRFAEVFNTFAEADEAGKCIVREFDEGFRYYAVLKAA